VACATEEFVEGLDASAEWEGIQTLPPLPDPPKDPNNKSADDPAAAALGHELFPEKAPGAGDAPRGGVRGVLW